MATFFIADFSLDVFLFYARFTPESYGNFIVAML
jgi:hypothetical protein